MGCVNSKKQHSTNPKSRGRRSRKIAPATHYPQKLNGHPTTSGKSVPSSRKTPSCDTADTLNTIYSTVVMVRERVTENTTSPVQIEKKKSHSQSPHRYLCSSTHGCRPTSEQAKGCGLEECNYITEKSDTTAKTLAKVPSDLQLPDLTICGVKLKTPVDPFDHRQKMARNQLTVKQNLKSTHRQSKQPMMPRKVTFTSTAAFEIPNDPKIIRRPSSRGGVAFEILLKGSAVRSRPASAARLQRKKRSVTKAELEESQERAQKRREELKQKLREKMQAKQERERQIKEALDNFAAHCMEKSAQKMEAAAENREARLQAFRERMKDKSEHAEHIRAAKKAKKARSRPPRAEYFLQ